MLGAIAQMEREQIAQNTRLGMQKRSAAGNWNSGNNVLGYEWVTEGDAEPHVRGRTCLNDLRTVKTNILSRAGKIIMLCFSKTPTE